MICDQLKNLCYQGYGNQLPFEFGLLIGYLKGVTDHVLKASNENNVDETTSEMRIVDHHSLDEPDTYACG